MRTLILIMAASLGACATTSSGLMDTRVERTILSQKDPETWANCVAENLFGAPEVRSQNGRFWIVRSTWDIPRHRWDFSSTETGSIAELRSTGLAGSGADIVERCGET